MMQCHHSSNSSSNNGSSSLSNSPFPNEESFLRHSNSTPPPRNHHGCVASLTTTCYNSYTSSLLFHGKFLITGSSDKEIHIHKHPSLSPIPKVGGAAGKGAVKALLATSDNKLISAHQDCKIRIWKINILDENHHKLTQLATLPTLPDRALKILVPKNHVRIRRHKKSTWVHHIDAVSALALSKDESLLYSVSWDRTLKIWRTKDFRCTESVANAHDDAINAIALSGDGSVYTASSDGKIKAWKKYPGDKKHSLVAALEKHDSGVNALALTEDGLVLFSGGSDRTILVWTKAAGVGAMVAAAALRGHSEAVLCLAVASDFVFSGSADKTVRIWKWVAGKSCSCFAILEGHRGPVKCVAAAFEQISGAYLLYSAGLDSCVKSWQIFLPLD